jgi:single-strand DNA-binding protein
MSAAAIERDVEIEHSNEIRLVGRVAAEPIEQNLPSGDLLLTWRLVVERAPNERGHSKTTVDVVRCTAWRAGVRRSVGSWLPGDVVEVEGALRRRFWRGPAGVANSYEVEARAVRRLARA